MSASNFTPDRSCLRCAINGYFDAQMARIDATEDRAEIAAILDEVSAYFANQRHQVSADELAQEKTRLAEMQAALTRNTKPARETA